MDTKLKLPFNLFIETKKRRKAHMYDSDDHDETDEIGSLPEFDSRSTTSSLTSRSFVLRSITGRKQSSFKRNQSRSSLFGSILKSSKKQTEQKVTEIEEQLKNEIAQLKSNHGTQLALMQYKLLQRENCIETLEEALQTQQATLIQFQNEIQSLKERVQDAEERNHALKITSMHNSSRSLCSKSINTSVPVEEKLGEGKYTKTITEDNNSQVSSADCEDNKLDFDDSASTNTSNTTGEDSSNHRSSSNSSHSRMKRRPRGSMSSGATQEKNSDEISCDGSRASVRSRRSTESRNSSRSRRSNADLPDYKLYRGGLDEYEQNEKSKRLRQQSRMRALAKRTNRGKGEREDSSTPKEETDVKKEEKRITKRKTVRPSNGRGSSNSVVSKDTAITAKTSEMSNSSLMQQ